MSQLGVRSDRGDWCRNPTSLWRAIEEDRPIEIQVVTVKSWLLRATGAQSDGRGFVAVVEDKESHVDLYATSVKLTQHQARGHAEGMLELFKWLYERRADGLNDPAKALAWGVEQRKAEHGRSTLLRVGGPRNDGS